MREHKSSAWAFALALLVVACCCGLSFAVEARTHSVGASYFAQAVKTYPRLPTSADLVGTWETRNVEQGRDVGIAWIVKADGSLDYEFIVDGEAFNGTTGAWEVDANGVLTERWYRENGVIETGRARLQLLDANTLRLTIIENGDAEYKGRVRIYRRRGAPQITRLME